MRSHRAIVLTLSVAVLLLPFSAVGANPFGAASAEQFTPESVLIIVSQCCELGQQQPLVNGLSCDGSFRISGAYSDSTTIRGVVSRQVALDFVNELLALNFFEQPQRFDSERVQLAETENGEFGLSHEMTIDGGVSTITLQVGQFRHSVELAYPAYGASSELLGWLERFSKFMEEKRGW